MLFILSDEGWIFVINNVKIVEKRGKFFYYCIWKMDVWKIDKNCLIFEKIYVFKFEDNIYM